MPDQLLIMSSMEVMLAAGFDLVYVIPLGSEKATLTLDISSNVIDYI